jgi:hypothetical protein
MSHVPVTLNGVIYPKNKKDAPFPATFVGYAWISGLEVGGGPIIPPEVAPPDLPGVWPPTDPPHPDHTLPGDLPHPEHPIVLPPIDPPVPPEVPNPPEAVKPPPDGGGWAWGPNVGWIFVPGSATPGPKRR